ncbi:GNAT family N-acetyltransferase [Anaeromyxobacter oryzisoli]|uniref:hypothetical protein n=1 Tax=Anaeromyxobacter oryzisoli TaxID=2925408 RepID=UPI001F566C72|nr:hypothetical protein [Anaeromyxobacter sp. SG63]
MIVVRAAPPEHYRWIAERAQLVCGSQFRALEAVDGDRIVAMVGFDGWTPNAVSMHVALDHPSALRHVLRPAFGIAFDAPPGGAGKGVAVATVLSTNRASLRLVKHLGFREVGRITGGWERGVDLVLLELSRERCRWVAHQDRRVAA